MTAFKHGYCVKCEVPLRTSSQSLADYPGTRTHVGYGMCRKCRDKERNLVRPQRGRHPDYNIADAGDPVLLARPAKGDGVVVKGRLLSRNDDRYVIAIELARADGWMEVLE